MLICYNYISQKDSNKRQQVRIQLLDNPFVNRWIEYMLSLSKRVPHINWYITSQANNARHLQPHENVQFIQKMVNSFTYFKEHKIQGDFEPLIREATWLLRNPEFVTQGHLNKWHRWFTTMASRFFGYDPEPIPESCVRDDLYYAVHDLNGYAHRLEEYTYYDLERRRIFPICKQWSTQAHNAHNLANLHNSIWDEMIHLDPGTFDFFKESYHHTVWMHEDIQGKDQMKAWMDHDELHHSDITGNMFVSPNVTFDPYKIYSTILDREDFRKESMASGKTLDRPPLGDILNIDEIPWEDMVEYNVESIVFDNTTLWKL
jgi:hypothetical protein